MPTDESSCVYKRSGSQIFPKGLLLELSLVEINCYNSFICCNTNDFRMHEFLNEISIWALPLGIVVMSFFLKIFVNRETSAPNIVVGILEIPVDIAFVSMSLTVAYSISNRGNGISATSWLCACFLISILAVIVWRWCLNLFDNRSIFGWIFLAILNYVGTAFFGFATIKMITGV